MYTKEPKLTLAILQPDRQCNGQNNDTGKHCDDDDGGRQLLFYRGELYQRPVDGGDSKLLPAKRHLGSDAVFID